MPTLEPAQDCSINTLPAPRNRDLPDNMLLERNIEHPFVDASRSARQDRFDKHFTNQSLSTSNRMKQTSYVSSYFINKQLSGDIMESIATTIRDYKHCAMMYKLDDAAMATNFTSSLVDPARTFFLDNIKTGMSFNDIEAMMLDECNSNSRQIHVRRKLESLRIDKLRIDRSLATEVEALTTLVNEIDTLVPQCPSDFCNDANKINFLRGAIIHRPWAINAIAKVDAGELTWRQFTTNLHSALSLHNEVHEQQDHSTHYTKNDVEKILDTFMTRYCRDPRQTSKHRHSFNTPRNRVHPSARVAHNDSTSLQEGVPMTFEEAKRHGICFICRKPWKAGHKCDRLNFRENVYSRIREKQNYTHIVSAIVETVENMNDINAEIVLNI